MTEPMSQPNARPGGTRPFSFIILAVLLMIAFSLAFDAWAAPANSPFRQSVPTKTPTPEGPAGQVRQPTATPGHSTPTPIPTFTPEPTIIPESSGGGSLILILVLALVVVFLLAAAGWVFYGHRRR